MPSAFVLAVPSPRNKLLPVPVSGEDVGGLPRNQVLYGPGTGNKVECIVYKTLEAARVFENRCQNSQTETVLPNDSKITVTNYLSVGLGHSVSASDLTSSTCARMQQHLVSRFHPQLQGPAKCPRE